MCCRRHVLGHHPSRFATPFGNCWSNCTDATDTPDLSGHPDARFVRGSNRRRSVVRNRINERKIKVCFGGSRSRRKIRSQQSLQSISSMFRPMSKFKVTRAGQERSVEKSSRSHTEASVAILLYDRLRKDSGYIVDLQTLDAAKEVEPGALVEIAGTVEKNAIDAMIDYIDAANIMINMGSNAPETSQASTSGKRGGAGAGQSKSKSKSALGGIRDALDKDRKRTPISNVLLRCTTPRNVTAVVTLRTENLRDLTLSELHKNSVRVLGKVTRVIDQGESMSPFENYGMALMEPETLQEIFQKLRDMEKITLDLSEVQVKGPALQVLPLMVFV